MNDRKAQLVARIYELLEARRHELRAIARLELIRPRVRILRTIACLMLMASTASAAPQAFRHAPLPARQWQQAAPARPAYCAPKTIIIVVPVRQSRPVYYGGGWFPMGY
ncbi:hypothetical protein [Lacipirellula sp.]|uniref:hypothetical protein n=1 Tax=Lacipirellula sp. TaxID=2691419 RepID=UPI003D0C3309